MSYEGYNMFLCAKGHHNDYDAYDAFPVECEDCGAPIVWAYAVDCTNYTPVEPVLVEHEAAQTETCECCKHTRELAPETYCVPSNAGRLIGAEDDRGFVPPKVPLVEVKFRGRDNEEFDTKDAAESSWYS